MSNVDELYKESEQLRREGKNDEAIAKLQEVLQLDDNHVLAHMALARLLCKAQRPLEAVPHSEKACQLEPNEFFNWAALSQTYQAAFEATQDRLFILKAEDAKTKSHQLQWQNG
jgi:tetratricopeptide (TPR) repeat protein